MKASLSWLKVYVDNDIHAQELADALTMVGLEVDGVIDRYAFLATVRVARVLEVKPHPNADKLTVCRVSIGTREVQVVCGAPNVKPDLVAPLALPGTVLPNGLELSCNKIRGEVSEGMLCSAAELALGDQAQNLMALDPALPIGEPLNQAMQLADPVFEIDLTPNRPDCLSIVGIAREIAAIRETELRIPDQSIEEQGERRIEALTSITIDAPSHCPRYTARLLTDVKIGPSPFWLQDKLISVGLRPINNIVDVTNFVMMETGQPLHAFDFDLLAENRIVVRTAQQGEKFTTLDGKERVLDPEMLMICDGAKPVAIGGVMGGANSEINTGTTRVLIESAYFDPVSIRKTAKKLSLGTDASHRFERGVDPDGTLKALDRAAQLMQQVSGGKIAPGAIDAHPQKITPPSIHLSITQTNRLLGTDFTQDRMAALLQSIDFKVNKNTLDELQVQPPSFRVDVTRPEDLMEEIARLSGYNNIPTTFPMIPSHGGGIELAKQVPFKALLKDLMTGLGFSEAITYSFIHKGTVDRLALPADDPRRGTLTILNPLSEDQAVMRTSLLPGLLEATQRNQAQKNMDVKLFELGKVFIVKADEELPTEIETLAGIWSGARHVDTWLNQKADCDFYDTKGSVETLIETLKINDVRFTQLPKDQCLYFKPGHAAQIMRDDTCIGLVGQIRADVIDAFQIKQNVFFYELELAGLHAQLPANLQFRTLPRFPAASRDVTLIIDQGLETQTVLNGIGKYKEALVESWSLFDVFEGEPIPSGKKSISFRIVYRSAEKTLEDEQVNDIHKRITDRLIREFDAALPA